MINQIVYGIAFGGFQLTTFNYMIGSLGPTDRASNISYMTAINCICLSLGSFLGGLIGPYLPKITAYQLHSIFVLSSVIGIGAAVILQMVAVEKPPLRKFNLMQRLLFDPQLPLQIGFRRASSKTDRQTQ